MIQLDDRFNQPDPTYRGLDDPTPADWDNARKRALDIQVGGCHYKNMGIQPIEYIVANKMGYIEGNVVKYITRHAQKGGLEDIDKVIHYCQLLKEMHSETS